MAKNMFLFVYCLTFNWHSEGTVYQMVYGTWRLNWIWPYHLLFWIESKNVKPSNVFSLFCVCLSSVILVAQVLEWYMVIWNLAPLVENCIFAPSLTGWPRSYSKYIFQIAQPSQYRYANLQNRFAVTSGSPSIIIHSE